MESLLKTSKMRNSWAFEKAKCQESSRPSSPKKGEKAQPNKEGRKLSGSAQSSRPTADQQNLTGRQIHIRRAKLDSVTCPPPVTWRRSTAQYRADTGSCLKKRRAEIAAGSRCLPSASPSLVTREFAAGSCRGRGGEMGFVGDTVESIRSMQIRQVLMQIISLGDALCPSLLSC